MSKTNWHAIEKDEVINLLETSPEGLSRDEVERRREQYGRNVLPPPPRHGPIKRFLLQFHNVLIYVLIAAAVVTAILGHWIDTGVIFGVVLINAIIGFIQEGKAERAIDSIRKMLSLNALVRREGARKSIPSEELVPGDIVFLQSGDKVPADLRLFEVKSLRVDEAALTGESVAVAKEVDPAGEEAVVGDRKCMAYSGTLVTYGQASGVVVATGAETELGRINEMLSAVEAMVTPLLRQIAGFGRALTAAILGVCALAFIFGYVVRDYDFSTIFLAMVGVAVAAIPEGLPAIITITLAIGVQQMAKRNAIVRKLPAVETLGSVTVICSDKTGTLTRNEMMVKTVITADRVFDVSGSGYAPEGDIMELPGGAEAIFSDSDSHPEAVEAKAHSVLQELARVGLLCNDSSLNRESGDGWSLEGDPTEGALLSLGLKSGLETEAELQNTPRTDSIPFESEHRFMATLHHDHQGGTFVYLKGAPEQVIERCVSQRGSEGDESVDAEFWKGAMERIARRGQRMLGFAVKQFDEEKTSLSFSDVEDGFVFLGLTGLIDPPRSEVVDAIAECRSGGIRVKMITGDHALTAVSIGKELGIGDGETYLTGEDLEKMPDEELVRRAPDVDVFARTSPEHKLRLVRALHACGEVVAMTGDGVNDAPALKQASVGVAMGIKGTEVSKQASEMVLADDNFASITAAVREGRTVYANIKKSIHFILPTNGGQAFTIIAAVMVGAAVMPITPPQILWVNMVTAVTLALALAFEPAEPGIMRRPPRPPGQPLLTFFGIWRIMFVSVLLLATTFGFFMTARMQGASEALAQTYAVNALVIGEIFYLFNSRFDTRSSLSWEGLTGNRYVLYAVGIIIVLQLAFTYAPPMQFLFATEGLPAVAWALMALAGLIIFFVVEAEKAVWRRLEKPHAPATDLQLSDTAAKENQ